MNKKINTYFLLLVALALSSATSAQGVKQDKMKQLSYLVGEWVGTTTTFVNGEIDKQGTAFERISYDLDTSILVIELNTEFLQLRTIVLYDEKDDIYYYHRFSKDGAARYPAEFKDGQLIVRRDENTRFFFTQTPEGNFMEYGEKLIDGKWVKTFEDKFINTQ